MQEEILCVNQYFGTPVKNEMGHWANMLESEK
jgi:hypothetical protein